MKKLSTLIVILISIVHSSAQQVDTVAPPPGKSIKPQVVKPVKLFLNEDGSHYLQFTGLVQAWVRYTQNNPGSTVNGQTANAGRTFDVGLRRVRFQAFAQITDRAFFYTQIGENSFGFASERKFGLFLMDATGEYECIKTHLSIGAGLGSWVGPLRFSAPSVGTLTGMDGMIYQQTTNDLNDQFVRRMMIFAKGKIGKLDYRMSIAKPFLVNTAANKNGTGQAGIGELGAMQNDFSTFSTRNPNPQLNTYLSYQFLDQEISKNPYMAGTYHGAKKICNIGAGLQYQKDAMWYKQANASIPGGVDTITHQYFTFGVDVFYDAPLNKEKGTAVSFYAAYLYSDYGRNYVRNLGVMNAADPGQTYSGRAGTYTSGGGSAFAMNGTGSTCAAQLGYKMKNELLGEHGTLMPYVMAQVSGYQFFDYKPMAVFDAGVNWLIKGHNAKVSVDYQNRPYFAQATATDVPEQTTRKGMFVLQYQMMF